MKKGLVIFLLVGVLVISFSGSVSAVPSIGNVPNNITDGQSVVISGSGFGVNALDIEWLGDNIENGIAGNNFSKIGWTQFYPQKASYDNTESHSNNNSLLFKFQDTTSSSGIMYDFGENINELYLSAWIKLVKKDTQTKFQWKNWRIKNTNDYGVALPDHSGIIGDQWWGANPGIWGNADYQVYCNGTGLQLEKRTLVPDAYLFDEWQRIEAYYKKSDTNIDNGVFEIRRINRSSSEVIAFNYDAITHQTECSNQYWRYLLLGHYYGNLLGGLGRDMKIYYDDIYIDNTRARVELCDSLIWSNRAQCEIQIPTAWADGSITINVNQGSFLDGENVYLFVVDENGDVSNGRLVTLGSGLSNCGQADSPPEDGVVSITELINYISQWKLGNVLIGELITAIGEWKNGC